MLYKYPQSAFPYAQLVEENRRRGRADPEFELIDTGIFADNRYFDVEIEYAKADVNDILIQLTIHNRAGEAAMLHVLPQLWARNTWSWKPDSMRPQLVAREDHSISIDVPRMPPLRFHCDGRPEFLFCQRRAASYEFYAELHQDIADPDAPFVQRQAIAGMLWSKQFYYFDIPEWLNGDPLQPQPPAARRHGRNSDWPHLNNADIVAIPDKWEYPWYAAWDLAFHAVTLALIDPGFAKNQLLLLTRDWYMHPNGQLPAYEWAFGDVNPPVHAWAAWRVYEIDREHRGGEGDWDFLYIAEAMTNIGGNGIGLWDDEDEFYYDVLHLPDGERIPLRVRSLVGLIPLFAVEVLDASVFTRLPRFSARAHWFLEHRPHLARLVSRWHDPSTGERHLLSLLRGHRMKRLLNRMLDETAFLSDFGVRSLSKFYG